MNRIARLFTDYHLRPPCISIHHYDGMDEWLHDRPSSETPPMAKSIGLTGISGCGIIARFLCDLRDRTRRGSSYRVSSAVLTVPQLLALYDEDVRDAFEFINLRYIRLHTPTIFFRETAASYAGGGFWDSARIPRMERACREEERHMPVKRSIGLLLENCAYCGPF